MQRPLQMEGTILYTLCFDLLKDVAPRQLPMIPIVVTAAKNVVGDNVRKANLAVIRKHVGEIGEGAHVGKETHVGCFFAGPVVRGVYVMDVIVNL